MAILFTGSSPSDIGGNTVDNTALTGRDPDFTPVGSRITGTSEFSSGSKGFGFQWNAPSGDLWCHYLFHLNYFEHDSQIDGWWMRWFTDGVQVMYINIIDGLFYLNFGGVNYPIPIIPVGTNVEYDFRFSTTGTVMTCEMYTNGSLLRRATWTTATAVPTSVSFDHYDFYYVDNVVRNFDYSEFIITDGEPTIGWRLSTMDVAADGFHTAWFGNFTGIQGVGDGSGITSGTALEKESWTLAAYGGPAGGLIRSVVSRFTAALGNSGPTGIVPFARVAGVDYEGPALAADGIPEFYSMDTNPATGQPWEVANFATLEIGVKST